MTYGHTFMVWQTEQDLQEIYAFLDPQLEAKQKFENLKRPQDYQQETVHRVQLHVHRQSINHLEMSHIWTVHFLKVTTRECIFILYSGSQAQKFISCLDLYFCGMKKWKLMCSVECHLGNTVPLLISSRSYYLIYLIFLKLN